MKLCPRQDWNICIRKHTEFRDNFHDNQCQGHFKTKYYKFLTYGVYSKNVEEIFSNWNTTMYWANRLASIFHESKWHFFNVPYFDWYNGVRCHGYQPKLQCFAFFTQLAQHKTMDNLLHPDIFRNNFWCWTYLWKKTLKKSVVRPANGRKRAIFSEFCYFISLEIQYFEKAPTLIHEIKESACWLSTLLSFNC